jgi:hypothetical protein
MMKKLLAITLVLGLASAASAVTVTPSASEVVKGDTISIVVSNDTAGGYVNWLQLADMAGASLTNVALTGDAGNLASLDDAYADTGWWLFTVAGAPGLEPVPNADHIIGTYTALDDSSLVDLILYAEDGATAISSISIQNTPEPMTLGLLGLGGLFLRRRK